MSQNPWWHPSDDDLGWDEPPCDHPARPDYSAPLPLPPGAARSPRQDQRCPPPRQPERTVNDCQLVSIASLMIRPGSFSLVELGGLEPPTPCLQSDVFTRVSGLDLGS